MTHAIPIHLSPDETRLAMASLRRDAETRRSQHRTRLERIAGKLEAAWRLHAVAERDRSKTVDQVIEERALGSRGVAQVTHFDPKDLEPLGARLVRDPSFPRRFLRWLFS